MAAELSADDGAGSGESVPRQKKWDITSHKGYTHWALGLGAYISANGSVRAFHVSRQRFNELRFTAAKCLKEMQDVESRLPAQP